MATPPKINEVPNYGDQVPFLPRELYRGKLQLMKFFFHEGFKGHAFVAYVKPVSCTTDALRIGHQYAIRFPRDQDKVKDQARMTECKRFVAACMGSKTLEGFDSDAAIATYCELGEDMASCDTFCEVETVHKRGKPKSPGGDVPVYTNYAYFPAE